MLKTQRGAERRRRRPKGDVIIVSSDGIPNLFTPCGNSEYIHSVTRCSMGKNNGSRGTKAAPELVLPSWSFSRKAQVRQTIIWAAPAWRLHCVCLGSRWHHGRVQHRDVSTGTHCRSRAGCHLWPSDTIPRPFDIYHPVCSVNMNRW